MSLPSFSLIQQQCDGVIAIDYYFAKAIIELAIQDTELDQQHQHVFAALIALSYSQRQGHTCLPLSALAGKRWWQNAELSRQGFEFESLQTLQSSLADILASLPTPACIRIQRGCLYTERFWQFEQETQNKLSAINRITPLEQSLVSQLETVWPVLFPPNNGVTSRVDWQQAAVVLAIHQGLTVLSGGPGTGKTYTVSRMLLALQLTSAKPLKIVLAAPTGKAAQRLTESLTKTLAALPDHPILADAMKAIPAQANTVHRLLGLREHGIESKFNENNKLSLDVLIIDESSMLDLALMTRLLRALPTDCRLILIGDAQQLPSVESGNVLPMLMPPHSNHFNTQQLDWLSAFNIDYDNKETNSSIDLNPCVELAQSYRFGEQVAQLANAINSSDGSRAWKTLKQLSDDTDSGITQREPDTFYASTLSNICRQYYEICTASNLNEAFTLAGKLRVLCAIKLGEFGADAINQQIEHYLRGRLGISLPEERFKGQLVMISRNIHALGLFNGDIGMVWPDESGNLLLHFDSGSGEGTRSIDANRITATQSVYAMTIHKSQGSEFEHAIIVLPLLGGQSLLSRELLYTGVTRGRGKVTVVSDRTTFEFSVNNKTQRYSGLTSVAMSSN